MYLIDTNVVSEARKRDKANPGVVEQQRVKFFVAGCCLLLERLAHDASQFNHTFNYV